MYTFIWISHILKWLLDQNEVLFDSTEHMIYKISEEKCWCTVTLRINSHWIRLKFHFFLGTVTYKEELQKKNQWMSKWCKNSQVNLKEHFAVSHHNNPPHSTSITASWPNGNMFQCRGVAYWHWISLPSIGVIVHQAEWKGYSTFPADGHKICAWFICPVINCEKQHPTTWVRYIHENAFI